MEAQPRIQVLSLSPFDHRVRDYKPRQRHSKTRLGCVACKTKRVKCDEAKPECSRCQRQNKMCIYSSPGQARKLARAAIPRSLAAITPSAPNYARGTPNAQLLHHFINNHDEILHMPGFDTVAELSKSQPLILHSILASAACHLRHLSADGVAQHRLSQHFHLDLALRRYQDTMALPRDRLGQSGADALILSAVILNIPVFTLSGFEIGQTPLDESHSMKRWPLVCPEYEDKSNVYCLSLQAGLVPLLLSLPVFFEASIKFMGTTFIGNADDMWEYVEKTRGLQTVPDNWIEALGLEVSDETTVAQYDEWAHDIVSGLDPDDVFTYPLMSLAYLRELPNRRTNAIKALQFLAKVQPRFRALLADRDDRALWMFGYWLGIMCRFDDLWWCKKRVKKDFRETLLWLEGRRLGERPGREGALWAEMMEELRRAPYYHGS